MRSEQQFITWAEVYEDLRRNGNIFTVDPHTYRLRSMEGPFVTTQDRTARVATETAERTGVDLHKIAWDIMKELKNVDPHVTYTEGFIPLIRYLYLACGTVISDLRGGPWIDYLKSQIITEVRDVLSSPNDPYLRLYKIGTLCMQLHLHSGALPSEWVRDHRILTIQRDWGKYPSDHVDSRIAYERQEAYRDKCTRYFGMQLIRAHESATDEAERRIPPDLYNARFDAQNDRLLFPINPELQNMLDNPPVLYVPFDLFPSQYSKDITRRKNVPDPTIMLWDCEDPRHVVIIPILGDYIFWNRLGEYWHSPWDYMKARPNGMYFHSHIADNDYRSYCINLRAELNRRGISITLEELLQAKSLHERLHRIVQLPVSGYTGNSNNWYEEGTVGMYADLFFQRIPIRDIPDSRCNPRLLAGEVSHADLYPEYILAVLSLVTLLSNDRSLSTGVVRLRKIVASIVKDATNFPIRDGSGLYDAIIKRVESHGITDDILGAKMREVRCNIDWHYEKIKSERQSTQP